MAERGIGPGPLDQWATTLALRQASGSSLKLRKISIITSIKLFTQLWILNHIVINAIKCTYPKDSIHF